jgi:outer membrane immunogenic protein
MKAPVYKAADPFSWAGLYAGVHAGYGWGSADTLDATIAASPGARLDPRGWSGGIQLGYNSLIAPNWLLGSEVDFSAGDIRGNAIDTGGFPERVKVDDFGTARVRLGYVMDRSLVYATGGVAWARSRFDQTGPFSRTWDNDHVGWTIGGGLEYAFDPRWSVKLEYLYADLGSWRETLNFAGGGLSSVDLKLSTVKIGINYRFGDPATTPAAPMPVKAVAANPVWSGSYIGAHVGYGRGDYHVADPFGIPAQTINLSPKGWLGGFQTGYNWQLAPAWLFGLETDDSFGRMKSSGFSSPSGNASTVRIGDFGTIRARLGYTLDRAMLYATGGLAYAREQAFEATGTPFTTKFYDIGWTVGGGIEYAFAPRWSAKVEYLYADLGRSRNSHGVGFDTTTDLTASTVKAGLNYKFDLADLLRGR